MNKKEAHPIFIPERDPDEFAKPKKSYKSRLALFLFSLFIAGYFFGRYLKIGS